MYVEISVIFYKLRVFRGINKQGLRYTKINPTYTNDVTITLINLHIIPISYQLGSFFNS